MSSQRKRIVIDKSKPCPRCGGDCPKRTRPAELTVPLDVGAFYATHWITCRALGEPVMLGYYRPARMPWPTAETASSGTTFTMVAIDCRGASQ